MSISSASYVMLDFIIIFTDRIFFYVKCTERHTNHNTIRSLNIKREKQKRCCQLLTYRQINVNMRTRKNEHNFRCNFDGGKNGSHMKSMKFIPVSQIKPNTVYKRLVIYYILSFFKWFFLSMLFCTSKSFHSILLSLPFGSFPLVDVTFYNILCLWLL